VVRWNGLTSTSDASLGGSFAGEFQFVILDAKGGMREISQYPSENEVVLLPGTILVVEDVEKMGEGKWEIFLRQVAVAPPRKKIHEF
jgi:hypothetical protein